MSKHKDTAPAPPAIAATEMSLAEACNEADKFGQMLRALGRVQEVTRTLRNAEQVIAERVVARETIDEQIATAHAELVAATDAIAAAKTKAKEILDRAQTKSDEADAAIAARTEEATIAAQAAAEELIRGARSELAGVQAHIADAAQTRIAKSAELTTLQDQLAAVNEALASARKLSQTLGNAQ